MGLVSILFTKYSVKRKHFDMPGFKPRTAGWKAKIPLLCYVAPHSKSESNMHTSVAEGTLALNGKMVWLWSKKFEHRFESHLRFVRSDLWRCRNVGFFVEDFAPSSHNREFGSAWMSGDLNRNNYSNKFQRNGSLSAQLTFFGTHQFFNQILVTFVCNVWQNLCLSGRSGLENVATEV